MSELDDLRNRAFVISHNLLDPSRCTIEEDGFPVGVLARPNPRQRRFRAYFAGIGWRLHSPLPFRGGGDELFFEDAQTPIARGRQLRGEYRASVDLLAGYRLRPSRSLLARETWHDEQGVSAMTFLPLPASGRSRGQRELLLKIFPACPAEHAPVLALLGIRKLLYGLTFPFESFVNRLLIDTTEELRSLFR